MGTKTPTNLPFCKAGPVFGTKFPSMMPIAIHSARKRSSHPRPLNAETLSGAMADSISCFSVSWALEVSCLGDGDVFIVTAV